MRVDSPSQSPVPAFRQGQYSAPLPGESLRIGHSGPSVSELQQKLNARGAKPPLAVDGKLGPKTQAAMLALLGSTTLDEAAKGKLSAPPASPPRPTDQFQPPAAGGGKPVLQPPAPTGQVSTPAPTTPAPTGQVPSPAPTGQVSTPAPTGQVSTPAPSAGGLGGQVAQLAIGENDSINPMKRGEDGKLKGWKELQTIFKETTGWTPTDAQCSQLQVGKGMQPGGKSWCGIWACHIFQKAGVNAKWDLTKGRMTGDVTLTVAPWFKSPAQYKTERSAFEQSIRVGDCITLNGANNHHAIVTQVNPDGTVETMDGNKPHVGPGHQKLSNVTSFYRPND